jgi:hypothetical protein
VTRAGPAEAICGGQTRDIPSATLDYDLSALVKIHDIQRVNLLSSDSELEFAMSGLTVIYGDNGSGKSGFVRILKSACRAKGADTVLPNVFAQTLAKEPCKAKIQYQIANEAKPREAQWESGQVTDEQLMVVVGSLLDDMAIHQFINCLTFPPRKLTVDLTFVGSCACW